jgi:hypothetical protein
LLAFIALGSTLLDASARSKGSINGKILDSLSAAPVSFATIRIFSSDEKKLINGDISNDAGNFSLEGPYGTYYAEIDFMGYESRRTISFALTAENPLYVLGVIKLATSVSTLDEVVVQAEKSSMELSLGKRYSTLEKT